VVTEDFNEFILKKHKMKSISHGPGESLLNSLDFHCKTALV